MRQHESCSHKVKEYEWKPNIASKFINGQVEVSFTSSKYATEYDLQLCRCASLEECHDSVIIISEDKSFTEGKSKWTKTLNATGPCDSLHIRILPYFPNCGQLCDERIAPVDCRPPEEPANWTFLLCLTSSMMVLVSVAVLIWYKAYKNYSESGGKSQAVPLVSVLVVYPAGNRAFQRAVVAFAEFLQSQWRCRVSIDVWERGRIAEQGPVRWLTTHTERADNVVIVCARRTESWESAAGHHQLAALRDHAVPASTEDVFSLALNMLEGQVQGLTALGKYCTVHLGDRPEAKCLPAALRVCKSFSLMKDVEKLGRHLHNSGPEPCCFPSVELKPGSLNGDVTGRLVDAIQELQTVEHL
ncbi:interleukin-17 receptor B isoform X2 [Anguilla anguilla]|nr:interleukin-17 receptor B isoform X2 [Anguilla anguilla]XP_035238346.1 interleukin-17 receptor B isoform X2 [Anguilla anguilla]